MNRLSRYISNGIFVVLALSLLPGCPEGERITGRKKRDPREIHASEQVVRMNEAAHFVFTEMVGTVAALGANHVNTMTGSESLGVGYRLPDVKQPSMDLDSSNRDEYIDQMIQGLINEYEENDFDFVLDDGFDVNVAETANALAQQITSVCQTGLRFGLNQYVNVRMAKNIDRRPRSVSSATAEQAKNWALQKYYKKNRALGDEEDREEDDRNHRIHNEMGILDQEFKVICSQYWDGGRLANQYIGNQKLQASEKKELLNLGKKALSNDQNELSNELESMNATTVVQLFANLGRWTLEVDKDIQIDVGLTRKSMTEDAFKIGIREVIDRIEQIQSADVFAFEETLRRYEAFLADHKSQYYDDDEYSAPFSQDELLDKMDGVVSTMGSQYKSAIDAIQYLIFSNMGPADPRQSKMCHLLRQYQSAMTRIYEAGDVYYSRDFDYGLDEDVFTLDKIDDFYKAIFLSQVPEISSGCSYNPR